MHKIQWKGPNSQLQCFKQATSGDLCWKPKKHGKQEKLTREIVRNCQSCQKLSKLSEIVDVVRNCQICQNLSKLSDNVKVVRNCQRCQKLSMLSKFLKVMRNCQNCQNSHFITTYLPTLLQHIIGRVAKKCQPCQPAPAQFFNIIRGKFKDNKYDILDHNFRQIQRQIKNHKDKFKMPQTHKYFLAKEVTLGY